MSDPKPLERLAEVELAIEELRDARDAFATLDVTHQPRVWTERINLDSTVKDGFRVKEVTITVQYEEGERPSDEERQARLRAAIDAGQAIANEKNHANHQIQRFTSN